MQNVYRVVDLERFESRFRRGPFSDLIDLVDTALAAVDMGLGMSVVSEESYDSDIKAFAAVCEDAMKDGGTWPSSVPYPVQR